MVLRRIEGLLAPPRTGPTADPVTASNQRIAYVSAETSSVASAYGAKKIRAFGPRQPFQSAHDI
jgi:hypothetical protein